MTSEKTSATMFNLKFNISDTQTETAALNIYLIYVLSGEMKVTKKEDSFFAKAGDFFVINVGEGFHWKSNVPCLYCQLEMDYRLYTQRLKNPYIFFACNSTVKSVDHILYDKVLEVLNGLIQVYMISSDLAGFEKEYLWYRLLDILARNFMLHEPGAFKNVSVDQKMTYVMQYICCNYGEPLSLESAAQKMFLSASAFSRWFKKHSGMNYADFVQQVRMTHSVRDLLHSDKTVTDIALDNGFSNASVFTKLFRKKYLMTPTKYRKMYKVSEAEPLERMTESVRNSPEFVKLQKAVGVDKDSRTIRVCSERGTPWQNRWNQAINAGEAVELLSARMQKQLIDLKNSLGYTYIRISNIFSEKLKLRQGHSTSHFNFDLLDTIMDFIVSAGMHPFIDLCDREHGVLLTISESLYNEASENVFDTEEEMYCVLTAVFRHFVLRYGMCEVSAWLLECWYDDRKYKILGLDENYARVFKALSSKIKAVVPGIKIGGCGLDLGASERYFKNIVSDWRACGVKPDFVTIYIYPYIHVANRLSDFDYTLESINLCRNILKQNGMENTDIYVTEWNLSVSMRNPYNDSCAKAAMMLRHMSCALTQAQMFIYSMASDSITNYYDSSKLLYGASGLLSRDGLYKPVFYAMKFWEQLSGRLLSVGEEHLMTIDAAGAYHVLLFWAKPMNYKYYLKKENLVELEDLPDILESKDEICLNIEICSVKEYAYCKKYQILNTSNGSLLGEWMNMGTPEAIAVKDMEYLKSVVRPRIIFQDATSDHGKLILNEHLKPYEIKYIHIYPDEVAG